MKKPVLIMTAILFFISGCTFNWGGRRVFKITPKGRNSTSSSCDSRGNIVFTSKGEYDKVVTFYKKDIDTHKWIAVKEYELGSASINGNAYYEEKRGPNDILMKTYHEIWIGLESGEYKAVIAPYYESLFEKRRSHSHQPKNTYPFRPQYDEPPHPQTFRFNVGMGDNRPHRLFKGCWVDAKVDTNL